MAAEPPPRDPEKEHAMLSKVLTAQLEPPSPDLAELAQELKSEGIIRLAADMVERVLMAKLSAKPLLAEKLKYLAECSKAAGEMRHSKFPQSCLEQLPKVHQMIANYGGLSLTCSELFGADPVPPEQAAAILAGLVDQRTVSPALLVSFSEAAEEDQVEAIFGPVLATSALKLKGRDLMDMKMTELGFVQAVCNGKGALAKLLVRLPVFHPPPLPAAAAPMPMPGMPGMSGMKPPAEGFRLQTETLLGFMLSPTCLDTALYKERSARQQHFTNLVRKNRQAVSSAQGLLRNAVQDVLKQVDALLKPLLRTDEATRERVLVWFGSLITGTEPRTKSSNMLDEGGGPNHFVDSMENSPVPMHQNLDARLGMQLVQARLQGFATSGMAINTLWCILELCKPIKMTQVASIDPFYVLSEDPTQTKILGGFASADEAHFGDAEEVAEAKAFARDNGMLVAPKFSSQIFWLALRAIHVLLTPVLKEEICFAVAAGYFQNRDPSKMEAALGEHFLNETIFDGSAFLAALAHLLNLEMALLLGSAVPEGAAEFGEGRFQGEIQPTSATPQWQVLPSCVLEDMIEVLEFYINIRPPGQPMSELFQHLNRELLLLLVTFMLGSGDHVKNPNLRGKATTILMSLSKEAANGHMLETHPVLVRSIIPACIRVFTAVEKTKQSYYDIRMQLKYQLRIPIMELFERMIPLGSHKKVLNDFASTHSDEFLKFLNQMMNDATMQLEEGLDTLAEVRKIVRERGEAGLTRPPAEQLEADEQNADGGDIYRRSRADPREHCKTYMKMGSRTIRTLWSITRETPMVIVSKPNVLQQLLHSCLNAILDRLVGPRCLELKGASKDFGEYNFDPKELLRMTAEMYVFVAREDKDKVFKMITEDGRNYRSKTFAKAIQILRREQMISRDLLKDFETFVQQLNTMATEQEAALANVEIPDEYLDPIMSEIMEDPVLLPTSNTIMDRKVIERHIMSNDDDPFNRMKLAVSDLQPQPELKAKIQAFCATHGIAIGED